MAKKIDVLPLWDWTTLVAAWRYYEHGHTIASAQFPADIIKRYWGKGNKYTDNVRRQIAIQFAYTDHGTRGEEDWPADGSFFDIDGKTWRKFYHFCKGWAGFFYVLTVDNGKRRELVGAFKCCGRWYPVKEYIMDPRRECYIPEEYIKEVK